MKALTNYNTTFSKLRLLSFLQAIYYIIFPTGLSATPLCGKIRSMNATYQRWLFFFLSILVGIGLGLFWGRVISPVEYVNTTPLTMRADFRTDYVLMVAETYQSDQDLQLAVRRLAFLGSQSPNELCVDALRFAQDNGYATADMLLLQNLMLATQPLSGGQP